MSLSRSVFSQSGPPKSVGGGRGGGVVYHTSTGQYIGVATFFFFFFFFVSGLKLDEKSIENGLEGQKFLVVCLFWGGCHHPNGPTLHLPASWLPKKTNLNFLTKFYQGRVARNELCLHCTYQISVPFSMDKRKQKLV